jgi:DNA-binding response OmpR family regulator
MKEFRVLLVDDEEEFVKTLSERLQLRGAGFGSEVVLNGEAALHKIGDEPPDVMVLDLKMPGIDGMEVLRRVKQNYPEVQVIILTGHGSKQDEEAARRLGAFDYLQKPTNIDDLVSTIKKAWQRKVEASMVAGAFAEEGMFDTARKIMDEK